MIATVNPEVQKTVEEHLAQVAGVRAAVVVAADGTPLCAYELDDERVEHWAALGATMMGVARRAAERAEGHGIRQVAVDLCEGRIVLTEAGAGSVLVVMADDSAALDPAGPGLAPLTAQLLALLGAGGPAAEPGFPV